MRETSNSLINTDSPPDNSPLSPDTPIEPGPIDQFRLAFALYVGWSVLGWLCHLSGIASIAPRTATIMFFGIGATNALFFMVARSSALYRPPAGTITLAQCVVGIAWATLFAFMTTGASELIIGIYVSIVLFAMRRVTSDVLNQVAVFAVLSYSTVSLVKLLSTEPPSITAATMVQLLIFAAIMLCLSVASRHVYRRHHRLESELTRLQATLRRDHAGNGMNSVNRRYILDLLAREKGRTDRSNVPFCVCLFNVNHVEASQAKLDEGIKFRALQSIEAIIRTELRDMDSLNSTGFHECFGAYSDKEFITILPQTNLSGAQNAAERVLAAISEQRNGSDDRIMAYGGIAEYGRGETISALLARAEAVLARAQASGASCVCGSESPETNHADIVRLETRRR